MNRRQFCVGASHALTLAAVTGVLPGCGGNPMDADIDQSDTSALPQVSGQIVNNTISLNVASIPALSAVGGSVLVVASQTQILVSRTAQDQFTALTAICTHQGCTVDRFTGQTYFCPCHGSAYTQTGSVVQGPATQSLATKASTFSGGTLTINV